ncbi:uncharacterized protein LOC143238545 isoform X1 [Tachypleus tridentatus]|uniref:uncharacterized protein LOC143238545 isoform X1 n=1 Tax=Tachypleus tridentatus TaxID=6853 RepID=UPI003FD5E835
MTKDLEVSEGQTQILSQNVPISYKSMDAESINSSQTKYMPTFSVCDIGPTDTKCSNGDRRESAVFQKSCNMSTQSSHSSPKVSLTRGSEESSVHARSTESDSPVFSLHSGKNSPKQTDCVTAKTEVTGKLPEKTQVSANRIKVPKANLNVEMSPKITRGKQKKTRTRLKVNIPENFESEQKLNGTKKKLYQQFLVEGGL